MLPVLWGMANRVSSVIPGASGPPSVSSSIPPPPRACQNPPNSPCYLHISSLAPPPDRTEMKGLRKEKNEQ